MIRYSCSLENPYDSFVFEERDHYDFCDYLYDNFSNEIMCFSEYEYDPGKYCEISSSVVEQGMLDFSRKYLDEALGKSEVLIEELDDNGSVIKRTTRLLSDIIYEEIQRNAKEEESFNPTRRSIQSDAVYTFAENSIWHADFLLENTLLDEADVVDVRAVVLDERIKWMWREYEVEPVIWFGQEFDYEMCCDYWMLIREYSYWPAADGCEFFQSLADIDEDEFYYSCAEYNLEMPSILPYAKQCLIKMDDTGNYDPMDIDSYFYDRFIRK